MDENNIDHKHMARQIKIYFSKLTSLERQLLLEDLRVEYCLYCGCEQPEHAYCQCWNDE